MPTFCFVQRHFDRIIVSQQWFEKLFAGRAMIETMMTERARDFRLDVRLRDQCAGDIDDLCAFEKDSLQAVANGDSRVIECLQDFRDELSSPECSKAVHSTMERGASDIRFDVSLAEACYDDRVKYCGSVKPVRSPTVVTVQLFRIVGKSLVSPPTRTSFQPGTCCTEQSVDQV